MGEGADRIASDNIGHQMLAKMGWAAGEQIGRGGGLNEPLSAIVKTNKAVSHLYISTYLRVFRLMNLIEGTGKRFYSLQPGCHSA